MKDALDNLRFYQMSRELFEKCGKDTEVLMNDFRGKELARQLIRSTDSISANIEEGYGRGFGKEYPQFLRIARGSARESKGRYLRTKNILSKEIIEERTKTLDEIIAMLTKTIQTLEAKRSIK
jgi:four helix bundle protein